MKSLYAVMLFGLRVRAGRCPAGSHAEWECRSLIVDLRR